MLVQDLTQGISKLPVRDFLLVPGGWVGLTSAGTVMYIIERAGADNYSLIVCNTGGT